MKIVPVGGGMFSSENSSRDVSGATRPSPFAARPQAVRAQSRDRSPTLIDARLSSDPGSTGRKGTVSLEPRVCNLPASMRTSNQDSKCKFRRSSSRNQRSSPGPLDEPQVPPYPQSVDKASSNTTTSRTRSPLKFFLLIFAFPVCGELLILGKSVIRHTHDAPGPRLAPLLRTCLTDESIPRLFSMD